MAVKMPERAMLCYRRVLHAIPNHPEAQRNMRRLEAFAKQTMSTSMPGRGVNTRGTFQGDDEDISVLLGIDEEAHFAGPGML